MQTKFFVVVKCFLSVAGWLSSVELHAYSIVGMAFTIFPLLSPGEYIDGFAYNGKTLLPRWIPAL